MNSFARSTVLLLLSAFLLLPADVLLPPACCAAAEAPYTGTWYEQNEDGGVLTVTEDTLVYVLEGEHGFTDESGYTAEMEGSRTLLVTEEESWFVFMDISYEPEEDVILAHTWPHTDGDGGYHLIRFARTPYVPPAPPVYDPPVDNSDPDAKRDFEDLTIRSMHAEFYDAGAPHDAWSDMAQEEPYPDHYSYDLTVQDDGSLLISSSFCREISLPKEITEQLQELVQEAGLGDINGIDVHTEGLPYDAPDYTLELTLASGEAIRSSANGDSVPENWTRFQEPMHHLLYFAFREAGYHTNGEFHSTAAMKRVGEEPLYRDECGLSCENPHIECSWEKAYDYSLHTSYFVFSDPENRYPELMKTLDDLSAEYRELAEETLLADYEIMQNAPKSRRKEDRIFAYSLYAVDQWQMRGNIFSFLVSTGRMNTLGLGDPGYGKYGYIRYLIDAETGKILTLADFFTDPEAIADFLTEKMVSSFGTHNASGRRVHAGDFPDAIASAVDVPEPEGIGVSIDYDGLTLWMPLWMFPGDDSQLMQVVYYDEMQDILDGKYVFIR